MKLINGTVKDGRFSHLDASRKQAIKVGSAVNCENTNQRWSFSIRAGIVCCYVVDASDTLFLA